MVFSKVEVANNETKFILFSSTFLWHWRNTVLNRTFVAIHFAYPISISRFNFGISDSGYFYIVNKN